VESLRRMIEKELSLSFHLDLPHELPQSAMAEEFEQSLENIGHAKEMENVFYSIMQQFYGKYIEQDVAQLEVNISWRTKMNLVDVFEGDSRRRNMKAILPLMESAVSEVSMLLNATGTRFRSETMAMVRQNAPVGSSDEMISFERMASASEQYTPTVDE